MNDKNNNKLYDFTKNNYNEKKISENIGIIKHKTPGIF